MMFLLVTVVCIAVMVGLYQWAQSGAIFWEIRRIMKNRYASPGAADKAETDRSEKDLSAESVQKSIQHMEITLDGLLRSSLRVLGAVALCVWLFVAISYVMDLFDLDWLGSSANHVLGSPTARARSGSVQVSSGARNTPTRPTRPSTAENVRNFRWQ